MQNDQDTTSSDFTSTPSISESVEKIDETQAEAQKNENLVEDFLKDDDGEKASKNDNNNNNDDNDDDDDAPKKSEESNHENQL